MSCDVTHVGECDRRKEQLLQLQRSKLERHMREMDTLKKVRWPGRDKILLYQS